METTKQTLTLGTIIGLVLIALGFIGFLIELIPFGTKISQNENLVQFTSGSIPAASFLSIMIGFVFYFPSMLEEAKGEVSTMRIIVFAVVMVFCMLYIKTGWETASFQKLSIDDTWVYILGLAFGSKAFQKFAEVKEDVAKKDDPTNSENSNTEIPIG